MKLKLIAILCMSLIILMPVAFAQTTQSIEEQRKQSEDIVINIDSYEPTVLTSNLLEENSVNVYANLVGLKANPFINIPNINSITVRPIRTPFVNGESNEYKDYVASIRWVRPYDSYGTFSQTITPIERSVKKQVNLDDLGYLVITLKRMPQEEEIPNSIDVDLTATINYELAGGYGLNERDILLSRVSNDIFISDVSLQQESEFLSERGYLKNGYLRLDSIIEEEDGDKAKIVVYNGELKPIRTLILKVGETSDVLLLNQQSEFFDNKFRIILNSIEYPKNTAKIKINSNDHTNNAVLAEGDIIGSSQWRIKSVTRQQGKDIVILQNNKNQIKKIEGSLSNTQNIPTGEQLIYEERFDEAINWYNFNNPDGYEDTINRIKALKYLMQTAEQFPGVTFPDNLRIIELFNLIPEHNIATEALLETARVYVKFGTTEGKSKAIELYQKIKIEYPEEKRSLNDLGLDRVVGDLEKEINYSSKPLILEQGLTLELKGVNLVDKETKATLLINAETQELFLYDKLRLDKETPELRIGEIKEKSITLQQFSDNSEWENLVVLTEGGRSRRIADGVDAQLISVEGNRQVHVTVLPGDDQGISTSNFSIHIPVEKRLLKAPSDVQLDRMINNTQAQVEKLGKIVNSLTKIATLWKKMCLLTFSFITVKNLFSGKRDAARSRVMPTWDKRCEDEIKRTGKTMDDCFTKYKIEIDQQIRDYEKAIEDTNKIFEQKGTTPIQALIKADNLNKEIYETIQKYEQATGTQLISRSDAYDYVVAVKADQTPAKGAIASLNIGNYKAILKNIIDKITFDGRLDKISKTTGITNEQAKAIYLEQLESSDKNPIIFHNQNEDPYYIKDNGTPTKLERTEDGKYKENTEEITPRTIVQQGLRQTYTGSPYAATFNTKCKAIERVTVGNGDYIEIEYDESCRPISRELWNVGINGIMGDADDVLVITKTSWTDSKDPRRRTAESLSSRINSAVSNLAEGTTSIKIDGQNYVISQSKQQPKVQCQDYMGIDDCNALFLACDAVMCPSSRCNLGGRWTVESVPQTGIIGSSVLCWANTKTKICLTGIVAGLQNIHSILEGYLECLKTQRVKGETVGICDKVRSVYVCKVLWQEVISIFNLKGGLISLLGEKFSGTSEGGGEYSSFRANWENAIDSIKFFTNEYASSAFAAYNAKSTAEIGAEVCEAAIHGQMPFVGDIEQLSRPESPPQFIAQFDAIPYSERTQETQYSVFYHIYAGEDQSIDYSVYLKSAINPSLRYYVTDRCGGTRSTIEQGGFASFTVDCVAETGYDNVCVNIEGREECGFGKVTTSFALNALEQQSIAKQLQEKIDSEEKCVKGTERSTASGFDVATGVGVDVIRAYGYARQGLRRICSPDNPNAGTNEQDYWRIVGDCGKDEVGRYLGQCWIDTRSIKLTDTKLQEQKDNYLDSTAVQYTKNYNKKSNNEIETEFTEIANINNLDQKVNSYLAIYQSTLDHSYAAFSLFMVGVSYSMAYESSLASEPETPEESEITEPEITEPSLPPTVRRMIPP